MWILRGISFEISQSGDFMLWEILERIKKKKKIWYVDLQQTEVWNKENDEFFFEKDVFSSDELYKLIRTPHFPIFLKLEAYRADNKGLHPPIHTFSDFIHSKCLLVLLLYDCNQIEIYTKKSIDLLALWVLSKQNCFSKSKLITSKNDSRTKMDVI